MILSICTISNNTSVCISNDSFCILSEIKSKNPNHCEELIPAIEDLLSKEDKVLEDVHLLFTVLQVFAKNPIKI